MVSKSKNKPRITKNGNSNAGNRKEKDKSLITTEYKDLENVFVYDWHCIVAFGVFVGIYLKCTAASIPSGDAGDFILAAKHFGVAHPPGYPLYVTAGYIWMKLFPIGNLAFRLNLLTSFIGSLAAFTVYITTFKITNFIPSAVFASGIFGFSHLIWFHSVGAEIFSLNNALCGLLLYWVVRFKHAEEHNKAKVAMEASFISGLSMSNQHTSAMFIAVIGAWMFLSLLKYKAITLKELMLTGVAFASGLIPYIQLPISAFFAKAPSTWGDQRTFTGILRHVSREEYGTFRLTASDQPSDLLGNLGTYTEDLIHELGMLTLVLSVVCVLAAWYFPEIREVVYVYVATVFVYIMFFCNQANIDHSKELMKGVLERFWMQSNIVMSVLAGCGVWCLYESVTRSLNNAMFSRVVHALLGLAALLTTSLQIRENYALCDMSSNYIMQDYGQRLLDDIPLNGVLMTEGDMPSLTARYMRYCENYRPDVDVVDQELIGFAWFKPMHKHIYHQFIFPYDRELYFKDVLARKGEKYPFSYNFNNVFNVHLNAGVPLYIYPFMKHSDEEWKQHYDTVPVSMLYEVRRKSHAYSVDEYLDIALQQKYNLKLEYCEASVYPVRSWEYVIAGACGHTIFFPPEFAHRQLTVNGNAYLQAENTLTLLRIFDLYTRAYNYLTVSEDGVEKHLFDSQHNKNYGVICYLIFHNLARNDKSVEGLAKQGRYARIMVEQWNVLYARNPIEGDPEGLKAVTKDTLIRYPGLLTDDKYRL